MKPTIINEDPCPKNPCAADSLGRKALQGLDLRPGFAVLCSGGSLTFKTYLISAAGEVILNHGLKYSSSDSAVLAVDQNTGVATITGTGDVSVSVRWHDLSASARVRTQDESGDCCANTQVRIVVLGDESLSMHTDFDLLQKRDVTYGVLRNGLSGETVVPPILNDHTKAAAILFSDAPLLFADLTSDPTAPLYPMGVSGIIMPGLTSIPSAFDLAYDVFETDPGDQRVIILFSDGLNRAELSPADLNAFLFAVEEFKSCGGVVIVFGIGATAEGFNLLRAIATPGYLVNVIPPLAADVITVYASKLKAMLCSLCAGDMPATGYSLPEGYSYGCTIPDNGPQVPDPHDYGDVEKGVAPPEPPKLPKLPEVEFTITPGDPEDLLSGNYDALASTPALRSKTITLVTGRAYHFIPGNAQYLVRIVSFVPVEQYSTETTFIAGGDTYQLVGPLYSGSLPETPLAITAQIYGETIAAMSVPGFPDASIRFTMATDGSTPADPTFLYPGSLATGMDYDGKVGSWKPAAIPPAADTVNIKAIARQAGYNDSDVSATSYDFS